MFLENNLTTIAQTVATPNPEKQKYCFEVTTTQLCNMRCTYCFENIGGHLEDKRNLNDYIPNIIEKAKLMLTYPDFTEKYGGIHFAFWGGESSMNMRMIKQIVDEFINYPEITFFTYSNGLDVRGLYKYLDSLKAKRPDIVDRFTLQFSYDGKAVHDLTRFDTKGNPTADKVIKNLTKFHENGFSPTVKSTIRHQDFKYMIDSWKDINELSNTLSERFDFNGISYAPTIDEDHSTDEVHFKDFKEAVVGIAKLELARSKEDKPRLLSWFDGQKGQCAVGSTMGCLSVDGNYYLCHAGNYADDETKEAFKIANINDADDVFLDNILKSSEKINNIRKDHTDPLDCQTCSATNCPRCEVINYDKSQKKTFDEKWTEYNVDYMGFCRYWKFFGLVDRALQQKIYDEKNSTVKPV